MAQTDAVVLQAQAGLLDRVFHLTENRTNTFIKLGTGRHREISPLILILSVLFLLRYAFLGSE